MDKESIIKQLQSLVGEEYLLVDSINNVNYSPHPYVIGTRHVAYASDNHGGMLGEEAIKQGESLGKCKCASPGCYEAYEDHTSDTVLFLKLKQDITNSKANELLLSMKNILEEQNVDIDGFSFVETPEKYRIDEPGEE